MFIYILKSEEWTRCCWCSKKNTICILFRKVTLKVKFWRVVSIQSYFRHKWRCVDGKVFELL